MAVTRRMASKAGGVEKAEQIATKASKKNISNGIKRPAKTIGWSGYKEKIISNIEESWSLLTNPTRCSWWPFPIFLLIVETVVNVLIIQNVNYTEIDWKAYMQEVSSTTILNPSNGTTDYSTIKGDTGPLVYPAGFVWIYSILYKLTDNGKDVRAAQYIFAVFYLTTIMLVFRLTIRTKKVPAYMIAVMCLTSRRIHSIYILRLFNDPVAMLLLYAALNMYCDGWWTIGSLLYSLSVGVKMNILMFAPAIFLAFIATGGVKRAATQVSICALVQLVIGFPFLTTYPIEYIKGSFDIGRVFLFEWTVNWRFLPEEIFVHKGFHITLLMTHLMVLALFAQKWWAMLQSYNNHGAIENFLVPLYTSNFVGMMFARSLHYQFYIWYYHQLPLLLFMTNVNEKVKLTVLGLIELCWNIFPSTNVSSALLHICHLFMLYNLIRSPKK